MNEDSRKEREEVGVRCAEELIVGLMIGVMLRNQPVPMDKWNNRSVRKDARMMK